jgi:hypothetical protein
VSTVSHHVVIIREVTTRAECLRILHGGYDGGCAQDAYPRDALSRLLASFERCSTMIRLSIDPIIVCPA